MTQARLVNTIIDNITEPNLLSGLILENLYSIVQYDLNMREVNLKISSTELLNLTEMNLLVRKLEYTITRSRGRTTIRGIRYKNDSVKDFVSTITTGAMAHHKTAEHAESLYKEIIKK